MSSLRPSRFRGGPESALANSLERKPPGAEILSPKKISARGLAYGHSLLGDDAHRQPTSLPSAVRSGLKLGNEIKSSDDGEDKTISEDSQTENRDGPDDTTTAEESTLMVSVDTYLDMVKAPSTGVAEPRAACKVTQSQVEAAEAAAAAAAASSPAPKKQSKKKKKGKKKRGKKKCVAAVQQQIKANGIKNVDSISTTGILNEAEAPTDEEDDGPYLNLSTNHSGFSSVTGASLLSHGAGHDDDSSDESLVGGIAAVTPKQGTSTPISSQAALRLSMWRNRDTVILSESSPSKSRAATAATAAADIIVSRQKRGAGGPESMREKSSKDLLLPSLCSKSTAGSDIGSFVDQASSTVSSIMERGTATPRNHKSASSSTFDPSASATKLPPSATTTSNGVKKEVSFTQVRDAMRRFLSSSNERSGMAAESTNEPSNDASSAELQGAFWSKCAVLSATAVMAAGKGADNKVQLAQAAAETVLANCSKEDITNQAANATEDWRVVAANKLEGIAADVSSAVLSVGGQQPAATAAASAASIVILNQKESLLSAAVKEADQESMVLDTIESLRQEKVGSNAETVRAETEDKVLSVESWREKHGLDGDFGDAKDEAAAEDKGDVANSSAPVEEDSKEPEQVTRSSSVHDTALEDSSTRKSIKDTLSTVGVLLSKAQVDLEETPVPSMDEGSDVVDDIEAKGLGLAEATEKEPESGGSPEGGNDPIEREVPLTPNPSQEAPKQSSAVVENVDPVDDTGLPLVVEKCIVDAGLSAEKADTRDDDSDGPTDAKTNTPAVYAEVLAAMEFNEPDSSVLVEEAAVDAADPPITAVSSKATVSSEPEEIDDGKIQCSVALAFATVAAAGASAAAALSSSPKESGAVKDAVAEEGALLEVSAVQESRADIGDNDLDNVAEGCPVGQACAAVVAAGASAAAILCSSAQNTEEAEEVVADDNLDASHGDDSRDVVLLDAIPQEGLSTERQGAEETSVPGGEASRGIEKKTPQDDVKGSSLNISTADTFEQEHISTSPVSNAKSPIEEPSRIETDPEEGGKDVESEDNINTTNVSRGIAAVAAVGLSSEATNVPCSSPRMAFTVDELASQCEAGSESIITTEGEGESSTVDQTSAQAVSVEETPTNDPSAKEETPVVEEAKVNELEEAKVHASPEPDEGEATESPCQVSIQEAPIEVDTSTIDPVTEQIPVEEAKIDESEDAVVHASPTKADEEDATESPSQVDPIFIQEVPIEEDTATIDPVTEERALVVRESKTDEVTDSCLHQHESNVPETPEEANEKAFFDHEHISTSPLSSIIKESSAPDSLIQTNKSSSGHDDGQKEGPHITEEEEEEKESSDLTVWVEEKRKNVEWLETLDNRRKERDAKVGRVQDFEAYLATVHVNESGEDSSIEINYNSSGENMPTDTLSPKHLAEMKNVDFIDVVKKRRQAIEMEKSTAPEEAHADNLANRIKNIRLRAVGKGSQTKEQTSDVAVPFDATNVSPAKDSIDSSASATIDEEAVSEDELKNQAGSNTTNSMEQPADLILKEGATVQHIGEEKLRVSFKDGPPEVKTITPVVSEVDTVESEVDTVESGNSADICVETADSVLSNATDDDEEHEPGMQNYEVLLDEECSKTVTVVPTLMASRNEDIVEKEAETKTTEAKKLGDSLALSATAVVGAMPNYKEDEVLSRNEVQEESQAHLEDKPDAAIKDVNVIMESMMQGVVQSSSSDTEVEIEPKDAAAEPAQLSVASEAAESAVRVDNYDGLQKSGRTKKKSKSNRFSVKKFLRKKK